MFKNNQLHLDLYFGENAIIIFIVVIIIIIIVIIIHVPE